jgi:hypothetical protein
MRTSAQLTPTEENDRVQNAVVPDPAQRSGHLRRSGRGHGPAFSDFRGYEDWQVVAVSQTEELLKVMIANPTDRRLPDRRSRQRQAFPRRLQDCEDRVKTEKEYGGPFFG